LILFLLSGVMHGKATEAPVYGGFFGTHYLQAGGMLFPYFPGVAAWEGWVRGVPVGDATDTAVWTPLDEPINMVSDSKGAYLGLAFSSTMLRDMVVPAGTYAFVETLAAGGDRTNTLTMATNALPPAPTLLNVEQWSQWPAGQPLPVTWQPGTGTLPTDTFMVILQDTAGYQRFFETPSPGQTGALSATNTSYTVPGQFLTTNNTLYVKVACYRSQGSAGKVTGQFAGTLLPLMVIGQGTRDASYYHLLTGREFAQDATNEPALIATNAYRVEAVVREQSAARVTSASVQAPGQSAQALVEEDSQMAWNYAAEFQTEGAMTNAWPGGTYHWTIDGVAGGSQESDQTVPSGGTWPSPLKILNPAELSTNSFTGDTVLAWTKGGSSSATDRIELVVRDGTGDVVLRIPNPVYGTPIPGTNTQLIIPAHDVPGGVACVGSLRYIQVDQRTTNSLGGAEAIAGRFAETRFPMGQAAPLPIQALEILTTNLAEATVAVEYEAQLAALGGTRPYTWALHGGPMPGGLTLGLDGAIQGIPTNAGTFELTFGVADASTHTAQQTLSLVITGSIPALYIATTNLPAVQGSWPYLAELASGGGVPPFVWQVTSGQLPPGLDLNGTKGLISGLPSRSGDYPFVLRLSDGSGHSAERAFAMQVSTTNQGALSIIAFRRTSAVEGVALSAEEGDPVSVERSTDLATWAPVMAADCPSNGLLEWSALGGTRGFYRARWGQNPPPPNPPEPVTPDVDTNLVVSGTLTLTNDFSFALTNALGDVYRLDVPSNAVPYEVDIRMQFVRSLGGTPFPDGYYGGVEFSPGGLAFRQPATLTVTLAGGIPADYTPIAYDPGGWNLHLCFTAVQSNSVIFPIMHFSGDGGAKATGSQTSQFTDDKPPCPTPYLGEQFVAQAVNTARTQTGEAPSAEAIAPYLKQWFDWSVWPGLKQAQTDELVVEYAIREALEWQRVTELLGVDGAAANLTENPPPGGYSPEQMVLVSIGRAIAKMPPLMARGLANAIVKTHVRAVTEKDAWIARQMWNYARDAQLLGVDELLPSYLSTDAVAQRYARIWRFELKVQSIIDVNATSGQFVEQVKSGRCSIEMDINTESLLAGVLQKGSRTNVDLVSWEYIMPTGHRIRPVIGKGWLRTHFLQIQPIYKEKTGGAGEDRECRKPDAPSFPVDARIILLFNVGDPVKSMLVQGDDGTWHEEPVGGNSWETLLQALHVFPPQDYFKGLEWPYIDGPLDCFKIATSWRYLGGEIFAEASYDKATAVDGGSVNERTILELYFAPKPLRDSDTRLPEPVK
jgi:hypothetical protein